MFRELDPLLHSQLRLSVISLLISVEQADFKWLREQTGATAGNLSVSLDRLSAAEYITIEKGFVGKMPKTTCRITDVGIKAFSNYVDAIKEYINH